jgi:ribonuclease-3
MKPVSFEKIIDYTFENKKLLAEALTHRSYATEKNLDYDNQRLEFLGDAVLEIIITKYLYNRYPNEPEGNLTKMRSVLANREALFEFAKLIQIEEHLRLGKGEKDAGGHKRASTLADAFESLVGALYLDTNANLDVPGKILMPLIEKTFPDPLTLLESLNPKGTLQEFTQDKWEIIPQYEIVNVKGPDHRPSYTVAASIGKKYRSTASAGSRKTAEAMAASKLLKQIKEEKEPCL